LAEGTSACTFGSKVTLLPACLLSFHVSFNGRSGYAADHAGLARYY